MNFKHCLFANFRKTKKKFLLAPSPLSKNIVVMTADRAPFFKQSLSKMAHSGVEFFSQLRTFAATLDKDCNEIKSRIENDEVSTESEGRSHLILRETLVDVQKFKVSLQLNFRFRCCLWQLSEKNCLLL